MCFFNFYNYFTVIINNTAKQIKADANLSFIELKSNFLNHLNLRPGGKWISPESDLRFNQNKLALIVPYRNREINLKAFLIYMHRFLTEQKINHYVIYVIEPSKDIRFNRARLLNIGYLEALKEDNYTCFIFHDVDMLPENLKENVYECDPIYPKQMAISISIYNYS